MDPVNHISDCIVSKLRGLLNTDQVKLWLSPWVREDGQCNVEKLEELTRKYAALIGQSPEVTRVALQDLQKHAIQKLAAKKKYENTGLATLKMRLISQGGYHSNEDVASSSGHPPVKTLADVELKLEETGECLITRLCEITGRGRNSIKLICSGRVIDRKRTLQSQGVRNGSLVMAILLNDTQSEILSSEQKNRTVAEAKSDAQLLAGKLRNGEQHYLEVADQSGRILSLPAEEQKSLAMAMTLHEKGKAAMKRQDYQLAILFLLEADSEFSHCNSSLLESVDNAALLHLDVAWCYLRLKSIKDLPDAKLRLSRCEQCFQKSYGANMERLLAVKGSTGVEAVLLMRLRLLQAIIAYHQGLNTEAISLLRQAEEELESLRVSDESVAEMLALGCTPSEARLGLRAARGNVPLAMSHVTARREEKEEIRRKEKEEKKRNRERKKLGKTLSGDWINIGYYNTLVNMGFPQSAARTALRQTNNNINEAMDMINKQPELLFLSQGESCTPITDELIAQVTTMGFEVPSARKALEKHHGNVSEAVRSLLAGGVEDDSSTSEDDDRGENAERRTEKRRRKNNEEKAMARLTSDLSGETEGHLDVTLEEEHDLVVQYKALLGL